MNSELEISELMILRLEAEYPGFDVRQQVRMMKLWWGANPRKRKKTQQGTYKFVIHWLNSNYAKACSQTSRVTVAQQPIYRDNEGNRYTVTAERSRRYL